AAGLILPSYFDKILNHYENTGEAWLEAPRQAELELIAIDRGEKPWSDPGFLTS
ncbi:MAG: hypothetical protein HKP32_12415, partial [Woeseia sp.]|nr:hypothetical protein [Woeseia sp.]